MPKPSINPRKIVVLSGAGLSAPSGLATFRSAGGLWELHKIQDVATPDAWRENPELVLRFYNARRKALGEASPNRAHVAIASLEPHFDVVVITQNVDDLHERAGSTRVLHLHGELTKVRSTLNDSTIIDVGYAPVDLGECCARGGQLRPHVVWFGEDVLQFEEAKMHIKEAAKIVVVGTSLSVFPAAGLIRYARFHSEKLLVDVDPPAVPFGYHVMRGSADSILPDLAKKWISRSESLKR